MKKQVLTLLLTGASVLTFGQTPDHIWSVAQGGTGDDYGQAIVNDYLGNTYVTGYFEGTVDFDPGSGVTSLTAVDARDGFVQKLDVDGNLVWVKQISGMGAQTPEAITIDQNQQPVIVGKFQNTTDFDPGTGITNYTAAGTGDVFIQKLDVDGNLVWAKAVGGAGYDTGVDVAVNNMDHVVLTGRFNGTADFDPGTGTANLTTPSSNGDSFVLSLNSDGTYNWAKAFISSTGYSDAFSLDTDDLSNVSVSGVFKGTLDLDPGASTNNETSVGTNNDIYVVQLSSSGSFNWGFRLGNNDADEARGLSVDLNNNIFLGGRYNGTVDFDPGTGTATVTSSGDMDVFCAKYDMQGNFVWVKEINNNDGGDNVYGVYADGFGYVTLTGITSFPSANGTDKDILVIKIDGTTSDVAFTAFAGGLNDMNGNSSYDRGNDVSVDYNGNIHVTGIFNHTANLAPNGTPVSHTSQGADDAFVFKWFSCNKNYGFLNTTACGSYTSPSGNHTYTSSGSYEDTLQNVNGCDSIIMIALTVNPTYTINETASVCPGDNYTFPDGTTMNNITSSTSHSSVFQTVEGCDSIIETDLTVLQAYNLSETIDICSGDSYTFPDGTTQNNITSTVSHTSNLTTTAGCDSIIATTVQVNPTYNTNESVSVCYGDSYTFPDGSTEANITAATSHTNNLTTTNGCDSIVVTQVTVTGGEDGVTQNGTTLTADANNVTYQWVDCNNNYQPISGETSQSYTATSTGDYAVILNDNGCMDTSACVNVIVVGLEEYTSDKSIVLFPNPSTNNFVVDASGLGQAVERIEIFDISGKRMVTARVTPGEKIKINHKLVPGVYLVSIRTNHNDQRIQKRLFVQ